MDEFDRNALPLGTRVHWYEVEGICGHGGFGITYLARDRNSARQVAMKEFLPAQLVERASDGTLCPTSASNEKAYAWGLDRFLSEGRTLASFNHPNIVQVQAFFELNGTAYMVMPYERGRSLADELDEQGTLEHRRLTAIIFPILDGLAAVHAAGFIHRDVKPDNIYLRHDDTPVLLDFGSARQAIGRRTRSLTQLVTPGYAPLEQYSERGEHQGPWTDIYGLGATLYRAVTGVVPMDAVERSKGILGSTRDLLPSAEGLGAGAYPATFLRAIDHALAMKESDRPQSVRQWRGELEGGVPVPAAAPAPTGELTLAVTPFESLSDRRDDGFIALGLTEDLVTALSKVPDFFVISRQAAAALTEEPAGPEQAAADLGVRYVLKGGVQRADGRIRISARLVDSRNRRNLWADSFDGELKHLFDLQDDIVRWVTVELQVKLSAGEHARVASRGTRSLKAWQLRLRGQHELMKLTPESNRAARDFYRAAHEADPQWARPLSSLALTYHNEARWGWGPDRDAAVRAGTALAERAIEMAPDDWLGYSQLGNFAQLDRDVEKALAMKEKAVELEPNDFQPVWALASALVYAGRAERAIAVFARTERLTPRRPAAAFRTLARAQLLAGRYLDALATCDQAVALDPGHVNGHVLRAGALGALGRGEAMRRAAAEIQSIAPGFTVSGWKEGEPFSDRAALGPLAELIARAGVPR